MKKLQVRLDTVAHYPCFAVDRNGMPSRVGDRGVRIYRGQSVATVALSGDGIDISPRRVGNAFIETRTRLEKVRFAVEVTERGGEPLLGIEHQQET
jgi:hypothetical protein